MKLPSTRIKTNDFPEENKELVNSLGRVLNPLIDKLVIGSNKNITVEENLPFEFKSLDVEVDAFGIPLSGGILKTNLNNFKGYICLNFIDINNAGGTLTSAPFLVTETVGTTVNIRQITGLPTGAVYRLVLLGIS